MGIGAAIVSDDPLPLRELRPEISEALEAIVVKSMAQSPGLRFNSMQEFMNALSPFSSQPIAEMSRPTLPRAASSHDFVNVHAETLVLAPGPQSPVTVSATAAIGSIRQHPTRSPIAVGSSLEPLKVRSLTELLLELRNRFAELEISCNAAGARVLLGGKEIGTISTQADVCERRKVDARDSHEGRRG